MEETIYNNQGNAIAYVDYNDDQTIYLWNGKPAAYLESNNEIFGFNGKHLGWFEDGVMIDLKGEKIGYNRNRLSVFANFEPFKSFKNFKPFKNFKEFSKPKPFKSNIESKVSLNSFLSNGAK